MRSTTVAHVAAKALWQPATLREPYCTFAEPHAIGLSSIAGLLHPVARTDPHGVAVRMGRAARCSHRLRPAWSPLSRWPRPGRWRWRHAPGGAAPRHLAVDGEREIAFGPATPVTVTLGHDGPRVLDVRAALAAAAAERLLVREPALQEGGTEMKAARFHGPGDIRIDDVPEPTRSARGR